MGHIAGRASLARRHLPHLGCGIKTFHVMDRGAEGVLSILRYTPLYTPSLSYASLGFFSVLLSYLGFPGGLGSKSYDGHQSRRTQRSMG